MLFEAALEIFLIVLFSFVFSFFFLAHQGRQKARGISRLTSRHQSFGSSRGNPDMRLKTADTSVTETDKVTSANWHKRSARTRERLQPIGADSTQTALQERQPVGASVESKTAVPPLAKRISSDTQKDKPGTGNRVKENAEIVVEKNEEDNESGQFLPPIK